ncbi:MAG TPA: sensor histidine kinase [Pyrinomonadaceae bacterium]|nr:sensor histidine kinase [Pyrinomonadaceae bacterium]
MERLEVTATRSFGARLRAALQSSPLEFFTERAGEMARGRWTKWPLFFGVWTLVALVFIGFQYFTAAGLGQLAERVGQGTPAEPPSYAATFFWNFVRFYLWAALYPLIVLLARRFGLDKQSWARNVLVHLPASFLFATAHLAAYVVLYRALGGPRVELFSSVFEVFEFYFYRFLLLNMQLYWVCLIVICAHDYYRKYREEELKASELRTQLAQAQLQALKMQLHPHFLFNTLNAVSELVYQSPEKAERMITQLSDMLRLSLDRVGVQEVPLKQELDFLDKYLKIEQTRFQERLRVEMKIDPEALDSLVPNMILQPLVENAVRHGIAPRSRGGRIEIRAARADRMLHLDVCDDGLGLPAEPQQRGKKNGGVGLSNTRARLERLYGTSHRFELTSTPGSGLTVSLAIPFREVHTVAEGSSEHQDAHR